MLTIVTKTLNNMLVIPDQKYTCYGQKFTLSHFLHQITMLLHNTLLEYHFRLPFLDYLF